MLNGANDMVSTLEDHAPPIMPISGDFFLGSHELKQEHIFGFDPAAMLIIK